MNSTKQAMDTLKKALQTDSGYAWSWHCNLAMAAFDEGVDHETANKAANRFMQMAFGVDTQPPIVQSSASDALVI
jgi:Tfp pilus assembly protein PilF